MSTSAPGPRPTESGKSMLLTVLGEFVVPLGGSVWTGTLVEALAELGFGDRNARQAIARLRHDGVIGSERHGRKTRWHLTTDGDRLLRDGAERIYRFGRRRPDWDRRWLVVVCSIPETQREKRRRFQSRLAFAGFGFVLPTMAVSPHLAAEPVAEEILRDLELDDQAVVLRAETGALTPDGDLLERSWDVDELSTSYQDFVTTFESCRPTSPEQAFSDLTRLVHAWRHFPFADPELPPELLPVGWAGNVARLLFTDARTAWLPDATGYVKALEATHD